MSAGESKESVYDALQNMSNTIFARKKVFTDAEFKGMMDSLKTIFKNLPAGEKAVEETADSSSGEFLLLMMLLMLLVMLLMLLVAGSAAYKNFKDKGI